MSGEPEPKSSPLALDPHVILNEIMSTLSSINSGIMELNDNLAVIADITEAADGSFAENSESDKRFTAASFLRSYRKIREEQETEEESEDADEVDNPVAS